MALQRRILMLVLVFLALATTITHSASLCPPYCMDAAWSECVPGQSMRWSPSMCLVCHDDDVTVIGIPVPPEPCVPVVHPHVAIMNHHFGVLTVGKLSAFSNSSVQTLVLVLGQILDVEENAFGGFEYLQTLGLDFNNLTRVKQSWLSGLTELVELRLTHNRIEQIDPGCFSNLKMLQTLNLKGNMLQLIDPAWFHGLHADELILGENNIRSIPPSTFHKMGTIYHLSLESNQLSCLDVELGLWVESLSLFDVGGDSLVTISDDVPQRMSWTLDIDSTSYLDIHTETISLHVSTFSFCITTDQGRHEKRLQWKAREAGVASYSICSTDTYDDGVRSLTVTIPFAVLATEDGLSQNATDQCGRVWEHNWGVTVDLKSNSSFQVVSLGVGNTSVAMLFFRPT
ncbi:LRIG2 [Branchiostoma lanceolatum]|uniref:LRIG2 protein n=1 Tax=Branchiostoma lanceolatum TaxID=7740 RepID=A0A8J9Z956_BRALA|nr:LRIG2 [Branchiostoma lanceolatum]